MRIPFTSRVIETPTCDDGYPQLEQLIKSRVANTAGPLFTTDVKNLFGFYLHNLPAYKRQHYNCRCCERFIENYGGLVTIGEDGVQTPLLWQAEGVPDFFASAFFAIESEVQRARVTGVFLSSEKEWGVPITVAKKTGIRWTHLSGSPSSLFRATTKTADQVMAERKEEYGMLCRGLAEFKADVVNEAVRVLRADALDRAKTALAQAEWLANLHAAIANLRGPRRDNLIWRSVATAPPGWCHVRTTMIGTLLEDIAAGLSYEVVSARWSAKMHPLQYQRPTKLTEGNIEQAERLMEKTGAAKSLPRRFAKLDDVLSFLWLPQATEVKEAKGEKGVFSHLRAKVNPKNAPVKKLELPTTTMTWEKFSRDILPTAKSIAFRVPGGRGLYFGLVTAVNPDAPAIIQWDGLEGSRNPVSWYFKMGGSYPSEWSLPTGAWVNVTGIFLAPALWQAPERFARYGDKVMFALDGAKWAGEQIGGGLFPEFMRSEYHEVRQVIESHSQSAVIEGKEEGNANGIAINNSGIGVAFVLHVNDEATYRIDRME